MPEITNDRGRSQKSPDNLGQGEWKRLRIAYVSLGTFTHIPAYLQFFRDRGHEVHWITYTAPPQSYGVSVHDISVDVDSAGSRLSKWRYLSVIPRLRAALRCIQPDILHGHYATSAGVLCMMSGFRPYIISVRGSDLIGSMQSRVWRMILGRVFRKAAVVHTVSGQLSDTVGELGIPAAKRMVLTQGVDLSRLPFSPRVSDGGPVRILCTRTLRDVYDPMVIVEACGILHRKGIPFRMTFAGSGPLQGEMERRVSEMGIGNQVFLRGGYSNSEIAGLLADHEIYVSSSLWDGTSISLLEAMACGTFPVVSRIASNEAWVEDGRNCLMFECGNAQELAECLERAFSDQSFRRRAIDLNRRQVEERGDRERNMLLLEQCYHSLVGEGRGEVVRLAERAS